MPKAKIGRFPRPSKPGWWRNCGVRGMAIASPCISCCCGPQGIRRPRSQRCCFVPVPACIGRCTPIAPGRGGLRASAEAAAERPARCRTVLPPSLKRAVLAILHSRRGSPGGADTLELRHGGDRTLQAARIAVSGETVRRWLHEWAGRGSGPRWWPRMTIPSAWRSWRGFACAFEQLRAGAALFFADELDISLLPKVGYQWMPKGNKWK